MNEEVAQAKRDHLLLKYINQSVDHTAAIARLRQLITSPEGNVLFNKVLWVLDDSPPDPELSAHLAAALRLIADSDFRHLFEDHKFALSVIARVSPAALSVLADHKNWPHFDMTLLTTQGRRVSNDWVPEFSVAYGKAIGLNRTLTSRLHSAVNELQQSNLVLAETNGRQSDKVSIKRTQNGDVVSRYLH